MTVTRTMLQQEASQETEEAVPIIFFIFFCINIFFPKEVTEEQQDDDKELTGGRRGRPKKNRRGAGQKPGSYSKLTPKEKLIQKQIQSRIARSGGHVGVGEGSRGGGESSGGQVGEEGEEENNFVLRGRGRWMRLKAK